MTKTQNYVEQLEIISRAKMSLWKNMILTYISAGNDKKVYELRGVFMGEIVEPADNEQVVEKIELSEDEAKFMKNYEHLEFYSQEDECFHQTLGMYTLTRSGGIKDKLEVRNRLARAYFNGYTVKKEQKYYIKFSCWSNRDKYLNLDTQNGDWIFLNRGPTPTLKTQFTQDEINNMQRMERARGLNLNEAKVRVPDEELVN